MEPKPPRSFSSRETVLTVALTTLAAGGFVVFLVGIMGLFFVHALVIFGMLAFLGCFHYFLWGRSMAQEATVEREGEEEASAEPGIGTPDGPHRPRPY